MTQSWREEAEVEEVKRGGRVVRRGCQVQRGRRQAIEGLVDMVRFWGSFKNIERMRVCV